MNNVVMELQKRQFGFLNDFHTERTAGMLEALCNKFGHEVIDTVEEAGIDRYGIYRWHIERTVKMLNELENKFGSQVMQTVLQYEIDKRREDGAREARELGNNSLESIIPFFTGGNNERIVDKNENEVLIKTTGCFAGRIGTESGKSGMLYDLHCGLDKYFVEGFNNELGCEIKRSIMEGDEYCIHRIYRK